MTLLAGLPKRAKDDLEILSLTFECQEVCRVLHRRVLRQQRTTEDASLGFAGKAFVLPLHLRSLMKHLHSKEQFWTWHWCFSLLRVVPVGTTTPHSFQVQSLPTQTAPKGLKHPSLSESFLFVRFRLVRGKKALRMWGCQLCLDLWLLLPQPLGLPCPLLQEEPVSGQSYPDCLLISWCALWCCQMSFVCGMATAL